MALTIEYTFTPLETDQRIDTESLNNLVGSLSLLLQGSISSVSISDGSVTWPKLNSALLSGGTAHSGAVAGGDLVMIHCAADGGIRTCTVTELLNVGLTFTPNVTWAATDTVYGLIGTTRSSGTVLEVTKQLINGQTAIGTGLGTLDLTADKAHFYDASATDNRSARVGDFVRNVTDRLFDTAGTSTAYTLTTNDGATNATGTTYRIKLSATCGATPTLNLNAAGAKAIRKAGDIAVAAGDFASGEILVVTYDATANGAAGAWMVHGWGKGVRSYDSGNVAVPATGSLWASGSATHSLGGVPDGYSVNLVCTTNNQGYLVGDELPSYAAVCSASDNERSPFSIQINSTTVTLIRSQDSGTITVAEGTSSGAPHNYAYVTITESSWRVRVRAWRFV